MFISSSPVTPPIASPPSSSKNFMYQTYQAPALIFIFVTLLPILYCLLWCTLHVAILDFRRRRQFSVSTSTSATPTILPLRVFEQQPRQQHQQVMANQECPICLEETEVEVEVKIEAEAEAEAEMEAISWQLVPECNHRFHEFCLNRWLKLSRTCPLCRVTTQLESCAAMV
ncbi:E3 ubiquitin-protein ligase ATL23-like [Telopea speciosissima]|uniref:E3 ubiquitin-protein ligase ATL23-like n=1 Tax=Telopea speciosissima TaxID=54955 RepID=UPI001CC3878A|nr:E3 ubiquitin-protein ligase ATL23-like [Telopea speciosissima]